MDTPRSTGSRNRREELLTAATHCFVRTGIRRTTMEDIAREARAGKATLYRHFANKDAVLDALLEREAARLERQLAAATAEEPDAAARLERAFLVAIAFFVEHPVLTRGREEEPALLLSRIAADGGPLVVRGLDGFARLVEEGVASGEFRSLDPRAAAELLMRLVLSYFAFPPMYVRVDDPEEARAFARAVVAGNLRAPSG